MNQPSPLSANEEALRREFDQIVQTLVQHAHQAATAKVAELAKTFEEPLGRIQQSARSLSDAGAALTTTKGQFVEQMQAERAAWQKDLDAAKKSLLTDAHSARTALQQAASDVPKASQGLVASIPALESATKSARELKTQIDSYERRLADTISHAKSLNDVAVASAREAVRAEMIQFVPKLTDTVVSNSTRAVERAVSEQFQRLTDHVNEKSAEAKKWHDKTLLSLQQTRIILGLLFAGATLFLAILIKS